MSKLKKGQCLQVAGQISICIRSDLNVTSTLGWSEKILLGENKKSVNFGSKGIIHTKIKVLLSFTHPLVVPNPCESLSFMEPKR